MSGATFDEFGGEVDVDLLADYIGGALHGTPEESTVATRIADDPAWRDAYERLSGGMAVVGAELGRFPAEPMPADLAARLESMFTPVPHLTAVPGDAAPAEKAPRRSRSARRLRWATPIAIAAGVVAFVGFSIDYLAGRSGNSSDKAATSGLAESQARDDAGAAAASRAPIRTLQSGTDYTTATLGDEPPQALSAPDAGSPGAAAPAAGGSQPAADSPRWIDTPPPAASPDALKEVPNRASDGTDALSRLRGQAELRACLDAIQAENSGGVITAQSVDYARFNGQPAVIVRFSAANGVWAWASGPSCGMPSGDADTLGSVPVR